MNNRAVSHLSLLFLIFSLQHAVSQEYRLDTLATPGVQFPVCIAFSPDNSGKFFFTEKNNGRVRIFEAGALKSNPLTTVSVTSSGEQGLLGVALHPQYPDTPYVYIYYTSTRSDRANMVVRYRDSTGIGITKDTLLIVPRVGSDLNNTNHDGGNIHFGPDGMLYVTIGEYGNNPSHAQDTAASNYKGKIHRLNDDGTIPPDNPFPGKPFWSYGHRNSFDFTFDSQTGKIYCTENGPNCNDEINIVPRRGNLGWPFDGNCSYSGNPAYIRPLYRFPSAPLPALTGIVVYRSAAFPRLRGSILFAGNSNPRIWSLVLSANGDTIVPGSFSTFFSYSTGFADIEIGPDGNIYLTNGPYNANRILRLRPVAPAFTSAPPSSATPGVRYMYAPTFSGTPPAVAVASGPAGMIVDTTTWTVKWTPTSGQGGSHSVTLRATNGAGTADQSFAINVTTSSALRDEDLSRDFVLEQNYPNPFNPGTKIKFTIPNVWTRLAVSIQVYDVLGQEVATLVNEELAPGTYEMQFSAGSLSSGVYIYRLASGGFVQTKSMMIVK